jgi:hypothetical protein
MVGLLNATELPGTQGRSVLDIGARDGYYLVSRSRLVSASPPSPSEGGGEKVVGDSPPVVVEV